MIERRRIVIRGLRLWGRHGVHEDERRTEQGFEVDLVLEGPFAQGGDELEQTVDYRRVIGVVQAVNRRRSFHLIERLAEEMAQELLEIFPLIESVSVRVRKRPVLPVGVEVRTIAAEVHRRRPCQR